jgi:hypothetical protein
MELLISNSYGARSITCDRHIPELLKCFFSVTNVRPATETDRSSCDMFSRECSRCSAERYLEELPAKVRAALESPNLAHTRFRRGAVYIYHRDRTSPSGVLLAEECDEKLFDSIFAELRAAGKVSSSASPLSPTEGLRR